ncbi:MAG: hypothetical protein P9M08_10520 [Candidatus Erginobacter occultus]|nr:hypothetical protein [Candidatus Erginobacter occultus]
MKKSILALQAAAVLTIFSPLAFFPAPARAALLTPRAPAAGEEELVKKVAAAQLRGSGLDRERVEVVLAALTPGEIRTVALASTPWRAGGAGEGVRESLMSNETAAIVLTLLMLVVVVGAVEISRH